MALNTSLVDRLPSYLPESAIRTTESIEIEQTNGSVPKTVYGLEKAPYDRLVDVSVVVDGSRQTLEIGEDVEERSTRDDEKPNKIAFVSDPLPDTDTTVRVTYDAQPVVSRYLGAFDDDMETVGEQLDESVLSKYIATAEGRDLDRIGKQFGELGRRGRRTDVEYRQYLRSVVRAFNATGTISDIKFVVAAATQSPERNIDVIEDEESVTFRTEIVDPTVSISTFSLNELIDLASPSGVTIEGEPRVLTTGNTVGIVAGSELTDQPQVFVTTETSRFDVVQPQAKLSTTTNRFDVVQPQAKLSTTTNRFDLVQPQAKLSTTTNRFDVVQPESSLLLNVSSDLEKKSGLGTESLSSGRDLN